MKNLSLLFVICLIGFIANAQWCEQPDTTFCPGNFFSNGNFETITGNPATSPSDDINLSSGWQALWAGGGGTADLSCGGTDHNNLAFGTPVPNTGIYSGMWIINSPSRATEDFRFREGMYNQLTTLIPQNSGIYTFTFDIANRFGAITNPLFYEIYGVYNPSNAIGAAPTNCYTPSNLNLWSADPTVQVYSLGVVQVPQGLGRNWQPQSVSFDSSIISAPNITHIMITRSQNVVTQWNKGYLNYDNFCLQRTGDSPNQTAAICCPEEKKLQLSKDESLTSITNVPNGAPWSGNIPLSLGEETFVIGQKNLIPITELRIQVTDVSIDSNYKNCLPCHDNAGLWASIDNANSDRIGNPTNGLKIVTSNNVIGDQINQRELLYKNEDGSVLEQGDRFKITFGMPPFSSIDCCVNQYTICYEISYKDANCNVCVEEFCSSFSNEN